MTTQVEQREQAYEFSIDEQTGTMTLIIKKGILGPLANQLKNTSNKRKASTILRKLGHDCSYAGDILYGKSS